MKIVFTVHAIYDTFAKVESFGWKITEKRVKDTVKHPKWTGVTKTGEETAMSLVDEKHILRVIFRRERDIIVVVTFHIARRGKYGSQL